MWRLAKWRAHGGPTWNPLKRFYHELTTAVFGWPTAIIPNPCRAAVSWWEPPTVPTLYRQTTTCAVFVPVTLTAGDVAGLIDFMDANRGQLWAEALTLYQRGQDARLPDWLKDQQREATDNARFTDSILDGVEKYLSNAPDSFTLEDIGYALNLIEGPHDGATLSPLDQQRLGAALRQCGYQKKRGRVHGQLRNVYVLAD